MSVLGMTCIAAGDGAGPLQLDGADALINAAVERGELPGAVLLVGDANGVLYRKAYGHRSLLPEKTPMTTDTVFDVASLTKPVATATSIVLLAQRGKLGFDDPVVEHIPEYGVHGKETTTIAHLLLHHGGLPPVNSLKDYDPDNRDKSLRNIYALEPRFEPGAGYDYTCCGYIVLGEIVERVSGQPLDEFAREHVFAPLEMKDTTYNPSESVYARCAPTTKRDDAWIVGRVHDPRAFALGGVSGNAGLFSTADDLARWCAMILNDGRTPSGPVLLESDVLAEMLRPRALADGTGRRGYGVGIRNGLADAGTVGNTPTHTGYTGTQFAVDTGLGAYYLLLTNRVHPDDGNKDQIKRLRNGVAEAVDRAVVRHSADAHAAPSPAVRCGVDVLRDDGFELLQGQRVAVITNHTGLDAAGRRTVDLLRQAPNVNLVKIFSPEHGLEGTLDTHIDDTTDAATKLTVHSLYGKTRTPTAEMLEGVDTIVFDIQDIGARYYTYIATMGNAMRAAAPRGIRFVVLDRPNPITGTLVAGPLADEDELSFTAFGPIPVAHGMTVGELARLFNAEYGIGCDLLVVEMTGWRRDMWYDRTGRMWVNPSPNMRNLTQALVYLVTGPLEAANVSVGRGTDQPFEFFGAPWIDGVELAAALNGRNLPGLRFVPITFTPRASKHAGDRCQGVYLLVTDRDAVEPLRSAMALAWELRRLYGDAFEVEKVHSLLKNRQVLDALMTTPDPDTLPPLWRDDLRAFEQTRRDYLIYRP